MDFEILCSLKSQERKVYTDREIIKLIIEMPDPNRRTRGYHHPQ